MSSIRAYFCLSLMAASGCSLPNPRFGVEELDATKTAEGSEGGRDTQASVREDATRSSGGDGSGAAAASSRNTADAGVGTSDDSDDETHTDAETNSGQSDAATTSENGSDSTEVGETGTSATSSTDVDSGVTSWESGDTPTGEGSDTDTTTTGSSCVRTVCMALNDDEVIDSSPDRRPQDRLFAIPFTADTDRVIVGAMVLTGEAIGTSRLAYWSRSGILPVKEISGGSWSQQRTVGWQGADFDEPVVVRAGEQFSIVWDAIQYSLAPNALSGTLVVAQYSADGGARWWTDSWFGTWMVRIYCCE